MPLVGLTVEQLDRLAELAERAGRIEDAELAACLRSHAAMARKPLVPHADPEV